jgi:riboflavin kinase/FMN adenylyltransferase
MKRVYGLNHIPKRKNNVVSLGIFDGVHIGHQRIIKKLLQRAKKINGSSTVITFSPHPEKLLSRNFPGLLISLKHRLRILEQFGVDVCWVLKFNHRLAKKDPRKFVADVLVKKLQIKELVVSRKFNFGRGAKGDCRLLRSLSDSYNFKLHCIGLVKRYNRNVSSTLIRRLIENGDLSRARNLLGRAPALLGKVSPGARRGRGLGYPTANLEVEQEVVPPAGAYAVKLKIAQRTYSGMLSIGTRPTFAEPSDGRPAGRTVSRNRQKPIIEVHIFDLNKDIYGRVVEVFFIKKLREEKKFSDAKELIAQLKRDKIKTCNLFKNLKIKHSFSRPIYSSLLRRNPQFSGPPQK